jgi:hypothetical protein
VRILSRKKKSEFCGTLAGHLPTNFSKKPKPTPTNKIIKSLDSIVAIIFDALPFV